jgi:hypothetical protein
MNWLATPLFAALGVSVIVWAVRMFSDECQARLFPQPA